MLTCGYKQSYLTFFENSFKRNIIIYKRKNKIDLFLLYSLYKYKYAISHIFILISFQDINFVINRMINIKYLFPLFSFNLLYTYCNDTKTLPAYGMCDMNRFSDFMQYGIVSIRQLYRLHTSCCRKQICHVQMYPGRFCNDSHYTWLTYNNLTNKITYIVR